jgi:pimeloyl-ACP methyl ester carboxylesterase
MRVLDRLLLAATLLMPPAAAVAQTAVARSESLTGVRCDPGGNPLHTEGFVVLGGAEQWVTLRGADCRNPVILFLHGGPGNTLSPYSGTIYKDWEEEFTVVQWDQRGAGRTYGRNPQLSDADLTVARMVQDGIELATYLAEHLGKRKIVLVGTSWGSVLGVHLATGRPDLFHAYVGVSQLVSYRDNQTASYRKLLAAARAAGDSATVSAIEALGPPPWTDPRNFGIMRRAIRVYEAKSSIGSPESWWVPAPAYATPARLAEYEAGEEYSYLQFVGLAGDGMFSRIDLPALGHELEVPVFLVHGAEDLLTVPTVTRRYFESIVAPEKAFVLLDRTGHDPNAAVRDTVYGILKQRAAEW